MAPFDELVDPLLLVDLAVRAEARGWDGLFLWDHIAFRPPVTAVADPWMALSAIAVRTQRLRLGPMVTPLSRRRVQKVARETATLDQLSRGRLILGVGLGANDYEFEPYGDVADVRERARRLDEGLTRLAAFWSGEFEPRASSHSRNATGRSPSCGLLLLVRCDSRRAGAHRWLTCLDGEAGGPQETVRSLLMALAG